MSEYRSFIGNWIKLNPDLQPHKIGYEDVLISANARASGAFKLGPVLPPLAQENAASELRSRVLASQRVANAVELLTVSLNRPVSDIAAIAGVEYDSMAANLDPLAARSLYFLVTPVVTRLFSHIYVNVKALDKIRSAMLKHPVVLLPSHRSYLDFILLNIALFICDMPLPTIAAATDFSHMRIFGEWLRKCGAFFVQRGTGNAASLVNTMVMNGDENGNGNGDDDVNVIGNYIVRPLLVVDEAARSKEWQFIASDYLHRALLAEYIHQLVVYGHHRFLEFFIEGKRSRTGKACSPKRGLLNSVIEPFLHGDVDDIYLCPVSICYDRFLEESLYAREMLGTPKPKESTLGLFQSIRAIVSEDYGSVVFTFGEPISLREKAAGKINRHLHALHPAWIGAQTVGEHEFLADLSLHIIDMHHQLTSLPLFSLVAACLTSNALTSDSNEASMPLTQLIDRVGWLVSMLTATHQSASLSLSHSLDSSILKVLRLHSNIVNLNREDETVSVVNKLATGNSGSVDAALNSLVQLGIYRNQGMFALFPLTAISMAITSMKQRETSDDMLFRRYAFLTYLLRLEFISSENLNNNNESDDDLLQNNNKQDAFNRMILFMLEHHLIFRRPDTHNFDVEKTASNQDTLFLASLLQPFVFGYSLCCSFLLLRSSAPSSFLQNADNVAFLDRILSNPGRNILSQVLILVQRGFLPSCAAWSISSDLIGNALFSLTEMGLLVRSVHGTKLPTLNVVKMEEMQEQFSSYLPQNCPSTVGSLSSVIFLNPDDHNSGKAASALQNGSNKRNSARHSKL